MSDFAAIETVLHSPRRYHSFPTARRTSLLFSNPNPSESRLPLGITVDTTLKLPEILSEKVVATPSPTC